MSILLSNSNTSATSSADARERFVAAALIAHEPALMARAMELTHNVEQARLAVQNAFFQLCRLKPDRIGEGVKEWLEESCLNQIRRVAPKQGKPAVGEEVRWKRIAGPSDGPVESIASGTAPGLLPMHREAILKTARKSGAESGTPAKHPRWLFPMAGAAALVIVLSVLLNRPKNPVEPKPYTAPVFVEPTAKAPVVVAAAPNEALPLSLALLPIPGPADPSAETNKTAVTSLAADARERDKLMRSQPGAFAKLIAERLADSPDVDLATLPDTLPRLSVSTATSRLLPLPVLGGRASLDWISQSVGKRVLPPVKAVRLEEILNAFELRPAGNTGLAKGVSLSAESLSCPWKPSATLLLVHIRGAAIGERAVEAVLDVDPAAVSQFRLLGYAPVKGVAFDGMPSHLPEKTGTTLLIELEPRASAKVLGEIRWKVDGAEATKLPILRVADAEPSNDARFAALLAAWSMWLSGEQSDIVDEDLVSGLARECAAGDLPKDRSAALVLIAKSLELK